MRNFYCRDRGDFILEEDKDGGNYRWATIKPRRVCLGHVNPESVDEAIKQHELILDLAPYMLSVSPLDCEALDLLYGFDFTYRGNHNELIAEALGIGPAWIGSWKCRVRRLSTASPRLPWRWTRSAGSSSG